MKEHKSGVRLPLDAKPYLSLPTNIRIEKFINEARDFLNNNFRACWIGLPQMPTFAKHIIVSADCFAYFTKVIFKRVYGRQLITVCTELDHDEFRFVYNFNPSYLREDDFEKLEYIARISGFSFGYDESSVTLRTRVYTSAVLSIYAGAPRLIYNALKDIFSNDMYS